MKTVSQKVIKEIEYLRALEQLYKSNGDLTALQATMAAIAALRRLIEVIDPQTPDSPEQLPAAA